MMTPRPYEFDELNELSQAVGRPLKTSAQIASLPVHIAPRARAHIKSFRENRKKA